MVQSPREKFPEIWLWVGLSAFRCLGCATPRAASAVSHSSDQHWNFRVEQIVLGPGTLRWTIAKGNTAYAYDDVSNLTNINYAVSADVTFGYDALKRLKSMKDAYSASVGPANQTTWTYTSVGALQSEGGLQGSALVSYEYWTNAVRKGVGS